MKLTVHKLVAVVRLHSLRKDLLYQASGSHDDNPQGLQKLLRKSTQQHNYVEVLFMFI